MYLEGDILYKIFPNSFWGVGSNTAEDALEKYNMETITLRLALLNRIPPNVNFGFEYNFENHIMLEVQEGGLLDTNLIEGSEGSRSSGLSFVFNFDDRDNVYSPISGNYLIFKGGFSSKSFGGTHSYNRYTIDMRKYFVLFGKHTLAAQLYYISNFGDVPFQSTAWLGGPERNRGYFRGRYMDKHYFLMQTELRIRPWKRLQFNVFFSYGEVASSPGNLFTYPKLSYGGGLRFQLIKSNPTLIRIDFGINQYSGTGLYFGVNEAF
jgi:outer membrane protein assembly factor BamA